MAATAVEPSISIMSSESPSTAHLTAIRHQVEPSSPVSSAPPSPGRRSPTPTSTAQDNLPDTEATNGMSNLGLNGASSDAQPKKRVKLTPAQKAEREKEKEEKRKEKEEKDKEREKLKAEKEEKKKQQAEEKARKEEEKALEKAKKDEERVKKEEEKAQEKAKRDEEKAKKDEEKVKRDEEKARKDEEKAKKERAQPKIGNFFFKRDAASSTPASSSITTITGKLQAPTAEKPSPKKVEVPKPAPVTASADPQTPRKSDFQKYFQPFFVRPGVKVAPMHSFGKDEAATNYARDQIDRLVLKRPAESSDEMDVDDHPFIVPNHLPVDYFADCFELPPTKRQKRGNLPKFSTKEILIGMNASPGPEINGKGAQPDFVKELKKLPRKIFKYAEDVRPPYRGTFTRIPTRSGLRKGRNPFDRSLPGIDYDYDSEAEWIQEPDDDGEELLSEDDDDAGSVGSAGEMDDFLDDEGDEALKRRLQPATIIEPKNSGLMWEGDPAIEHYEHFRIDFLLPTHTGPIDPFSTKYWEKEPVKEAKKPGRRPQTLIEKAFQNQHAVKQEVDGDVEMTGGPSVVSSSSLAAASGTPSLDFQLTYPVDSWQNELKTVFASHADLEKAITVATGNDMTKLALHEALKKELPSITKDALKKFLNGHCIRDKTTKTWSVDLTKTGGGTYNRIIA